MRCVGSITYRQSIGRISDLLEFRACVDRFGFLGLQLCMRQCHDGGSRIIVVSAEITPSDDEMPAPARTRRDGLVRSLLWVVVLGSCCAVAWLMTGPAPKPAPTTAQVDAPPFVIRDGTGSDALERRAAAALAQGSWAQAASLFERAASERPADPMPAVGLVIARWHRIGAASAIRSLDHIGSQHPEDAWVMLERGLARVMTSAPDATTVLERARTTAMLSPSTLDIARRADDVLHPGIAAGYPPLLVRESDGETADQRRQIRNIVSAVRVDDRHAAARYAAVVPRNEVSTAVAVAAALGRFSKDRPLTTTSELAVIRDRAATGPDRAMAALHHAIVVIWVSGPTRAVPELHRIARQPDSGRWGAQAVAIERALAARS